MEKKLILSILACGVITSIAAITANDTSLFPDNLSHAEVVGAKTLSLTGSQLATYSTFNNVTIDSRNDYSFVIDQGDGKYINGLLLFGDCGNQTVYDIGHYKMDRHVGGYDNEYFNFNLILGITNIVSVKIKWTVTFGDYTNNRVDFHIETSDDFLSDNYVAENYVGSLPSNVRRNSDSGSYYEYVYATERVDLKNNVLVEQSGKKVLEESGTNIVNFRVGGFLDNTPGENSVDIQIDLLEIEYSC